MSWFTLTGESMPVIWADQAYPNNKLIKPASMQLVAGLSELITGNSNPEFLKGLMMDFCNLAITVLTPPSFGIALPNKQGVYPVSFFTGKGPESSTVIGNLTPGSIPAFNITGVATGLDAVYYDKTRRTPSLTGTGVLPEALSYTRDYQFWAATIGLRAASFRLHHPNTRSYDLSWYAPISANTPIVLH